ncbi:MAG TPA: DUF6159 family protein, partial [Roseiflexaceae bacterium]|nr:DUF6159 family protein [Roseiflexaceae bacterium]
MKTIKNIWKTLTDSFGVLARSGSAYRYPLLSYAILLLITFAVAVSFLGKALGDVQAGMSRIWLFLLIYLLYIALYAIIAFFNVAMVNSIAGRLDGGEPNIGAALARAAQRLGSIGAYTLVSATLGLLGFLARTLINPLVGIIIAPLVGDKLWSRWRQISYTVPIQLAVPVVALDEPAPQRIFQRSEQLVKATWGERVKPAHSINLLGLFVLLPVVAIFAMPALQQGAAEQNADLIRRGLSVLLLATLTFTQLKSVVDAIFTLAAYRYATTRN